MEGGEKPRSPFKNLRFAKEKERGEGSGSALSPTLGSPVTPGGTSGGGGKPAAGRDGLVKRRHSHEPKVNVYTECGRHGDDWLGLNSVAGAVKKIWERRE